MLIHDPEADALYIRLTDEPLTRGEVKRSASPWCGWSSTRGRAATSSAARGRAAQHARSSARSSPTSHGSSTAI